ncbi:MAG: S8 family serine peptidase [Bacteroidetes bacterium]|nr:S8 family serine peptidase [Bacteroidota bacterium]HET6243810.1 S8 family serine peptidase [Bacteroidia bacterium]
MRKISSLIFVMLINITVFAQNYVPGEIIVRIDKEISVQQFAQQIQTVNITPTKELSKRMNIWLFSFPTQIPIDTVINRVKKNSNAIYVQPNRFVQQRANNPNDPNFSNQWGLTKIKAPQAWDIVTGGTTVTNERIVIAVIDGGFDLTHPDIGYWQNTNEIPNNGIDDDNNGYIDDFNGWNAYNSNGNIIIDNHGTHVAGIAGARGNNGIGISGVNWNIEIMPIMGSSGTESVVIEALGYALEMRTLYNQTNGAQGAFIVVTNGSFGVDKADAADYPLWCSIYDDLGQVGILNIAATANGNWDVDEKGDVPTTCSSNFLISVTNTDQNDDLHNNAAWGKNSIDLAAPGTGIISTLPNNNYGNLTGTSMAAPHVAGAVALMYAAACEKMILDYRNNPAGVALSIKQFLLNNSDPVWYLLLKIGYGRLNVYRSIIKMFEQYDLSLYVTGTEAASKQYDAINSIVVENYSVENHNVTFRAGQSITFLPGTHLKPEPGKTIRAFIDEATFGCAIPYEPLTVDLLAPEYAYCASGNSPITCNAIASGGKIPYSYVWYSRVITSNNWLTHNYNNPNIEFLSNESFYVKVEVTDNRGISVMSVTKLITCIEGGRIASTDSTTNPDLAKIDLTKYSTSETSEQTTSTIIEQKYLRQTFNVFPNPSIGNVNIAFTLEKSSRVTLQLTDAKGSKVADIIYNKLYEAGNHTFEYDGKNLTPGLYFYNITTDEGSNALKLILTK